MAKVNYKQVIHNIKEKYLAATGDTEKITYGNIDSKIEDALASGGGYGDFTVTGTVPANITVNTSRTALTVHEAT